MEKLKSNWKFVIYWFIAMSLMNVYIIPTYINEAPITAKTITIGVAVALIIALIMGLLSQKPEEKQK